MSYMIYDKNGWVGDLAGPSMLLDFYEKAGHLPAVMDFFDKAEADQNHVNMMIYELQHETALVPTTLRELLLKAQPPVLITDGAGDERIEKFDEPVPEDD
jgi:hypothetical protein